METKIVHCNRDYDHSANWPDLLERGDKLEIILGKPWHGELVLDTVSLDPEGRFFIVSYNSQESETMMSGPSRTYMLQIGTPGNLVEARENKDVRRIAHALYKCEDIPANEFIQVMAMGGSPETAFPDVWEKGLMAFYYDTGKESGYFSIPMDKTEFPEIYPVGGKPIKLERVKMKYPRDPGIEKTLRDNPESLQRYLNNLTSF